MEIKDLTNVDAAELMTNTVGMVETALDILNGDSSDPVTMISIDIVKATVIKPLEASIIELASRKLDKAERKTLRKIAKGHREINQLV